MVSAFVRRSIPLHGKMGNNAKPVQWLVYGCSHLVTGVWVGMKIVQPAFKVLPAGQAVVAPPVWAYFINLLALMKNLKVSKGEFERPVQIFDKSRDCYILQRPSATLQNTDN
jgi:penicillin-binding protein 1A